MVRRTDAGRLRQLAQAAGDAYQEGLRESENLLREAEKAANEANARLSLAIAQRNAAFRELGWQIPVEPTNQQVVKWWKDSPGDWTYDGKILHVVDAVE